jgi:alpha-tubulin suppressor-like RCC1 family protein
MPLAKFRLWLTGIIIINLVSGCAKISGCGSNGDQNVETFSVGGTLSGLADGTSVVLQNNGGDNLTLTANGPFAFATKLDNGAAYVVTVLTQPTNTNKICTVTNASGVLAGADITDVMVSCGVPVSITWFLASSQVVSAGDTVTLSWVTQEASSCEINPGSIQATPTGSAKVHVAVSATTTFILSCQGWDGPVNSTPVTVSVTDSNWSQVSAGMRHTCAMKNDGRIFCWGDGEYGQLGDNSTSGSTVPVQENTLATDWAQLSTGSYHNCALKNDGRIFCWGGNGNGELGNNSASGSLVPVQENTAATDWAQVSAGSYHTCAVKKAGRIFCWGRGTEGQLGNNSTSGSLVPVQEYTAANDWAQVSAGTYQTCAMKNDGRLFCWGYGEWANLGDGSIGGSLVPVQISTAANDWAQVSDGTYHTCAVKKDGRLFCWGFVQYGELGNNSAGGSLVPVQEYTAANDWAQVSAGNYNTCAVKQDGRLFCWGRGMEGQLNDNLTLASPVPVQENTTAADWAQVSVGGYHTCAVKQDGRIFCWGDDRYGQLGNNSTSRSLVPVQEYAAANDWAQVTTGWGHTCAVKNDGRIFCWGYNGGYTYFGGPNINLILGSLVPVEENTLATDWTQVSAGGSQTCAVKQDGRLFCWGDNSYGQGGYTSTYKSYVPVQENTLAIDWAQVSAGWVHTCAMKSDGRIFCFGDGEYGQLGNNSTSQSMVPVQENTLATDWAQVSAGGYHTCAVKQDGRIFCFGDGEYGQLGNNSTLKSYVPVQESTLATDWAQVSAGGSQTCAVKQDGRIFCWGWGIYGQLGNNSTSQSLVPVQENTLATDWAKISVGWGHTCAVKKDGRIFCFGDGEYGQLGNNSTSGSLVPVQESMSATDWAQISAGGLHTCAVKKDGWLFCWGDGAYGQLGSPNLGPVWPVD